MAKRHRREPKTRDMLQECFHSGQLFVAEEKLPGVDELLESDEAAAGWIREQEHRIWSSIRDLDEILFERSLASWIRGWEKLNEIVAEDYRKTHPGPETWELRFIKWMKIKFIHFESEKLGSFYLVPKRPKRRPRAEHWYTVDEMLDMLHPNIAATINTFGCLPARPESLEGPERGEKHLTIDLTDPEEAVVAFTVPGGPKYDRESFRRRIDPDDSELQQCDDDPAI